MNHRRIAALTLFAAAACDPGTLKDPDRFRACMIDVETEIFGRGVSGGAKCGAAGCHSAMSPANGLDLVSPGVAMRIATTNSTFCQNKPMVSFLAEKLTENPSCGSPMPLGMMLPNNELKCVRDYLASIAADGGT